MGCEGEAVTKKTFDVIAEGLTEALACSRSLPTQARLHVPPEVDVRALRARNGLSQETFASSFGLTSLMRIAPDAQ